MREELLLLLLLLVCYCCGCPREPSPYHSNVGKRPGDNGYVIKVEGDPKKYVPGEVYTGKFQLSLKHRRKPRHRTHFNRKNLHTPCVQELMGS